MFNLSGRFGDCLKVALKLVLTVIGDSIKELIKLATIEECELCRTKEGLVTSDLGDVYFL